MKLATTILFVAALVTACSSSSPDRRGSIDERQERIASERTPEPAQNRDQLYGPGAPEPVESDFDRDGDGISDADEVNAEPDNTARNERDEKALTPIDQSNDSSDIEITQAIRKKVIGDDELSFNAKNVKIITVGGKVTLRGPVESPTESATIERSARDVPGVTKVENQLEVK
jgi:virulence-associated protein VagC